MHNHGEFQDSSSSEFRRRVETNQRWLATSLQGSYDFIICGAGSSGSVVARRLSEKPGVQVLLLEAGGTDDVPEVMDPEKWVRNLGTEREWGFQAEPNPNLNDRTIPYAMGKALGGGSSINVGVWSRGHKSDWDYFAEESGDPGWGYDSVLDLYHRIEDFQGAPDPHYRGTGGPMYLENTEKDLHPFHRAALDSAESVGTPRFENPNGSMMEGGGGCSTADRIFRDGTRQSVFRSYTFPRMAHSNLTVLTGVLVTRLTFEGRRATGVEAMYEGQLRRFDARAEVIVSMGAIETPKLLMQSGIGDQAELQRFSIPVVQHLPGVGQNLQDHPSVSCIWEFSEVPEKVGFLTEAVAFWKSDPTLEVPDLLMFPLMAPYTSAEIMARVQPKQHSWTIASVLLRPKSRGQIRLAGPNASDPPRIDANILSDPADLKALMASLKTCREIGYASALDRYRGKEVLPGKLQTTELEQLVREGTTNFSHQTCTAKMGRDAMSVVDAQLKVYGIEDLRIVDASVMPRTTTGNTMAACVVIGERAAEMLYLTHGL